MKNKIIQYSILSFIVFLLYDETITGQQLYFVENQSAKVQKSDYDGNNLSLLTTSLLGLYGIATDISNSKIFYTNVVSDEILTAALDGSSPTVLLNSSNGVNGPRGIAIDGINSKIYWAEVISGKIKRADYNGSNISEVLPGLSSPVDVALDLINNKLYWSDNGVGQKKISRSNLDGTSPEDIITGLDQVGGIEIDAENGKLYWADFGTTDKISRSNTDGSVPEVLITIPSGSPRGIAVDKNTDKLFWSDVLGNVINTAKRDGTLPSVIVSTLSHPIGISTDWAVQLPVELTTFSASILNNTVALNWETATETNNYGFEIERIHGSKLGNENWEKIGFVVGYGNSNSPRKYSFNDKLKIQGLYTYRLKQIDTYGSYEYSEKIEVQFEIVPTKNFLLQNYPNPFNPSTNIQYSIINRQFVSLKIFNVLGIEIESLVNEDKNIGTYEVTWNAANLPSGYYYYKLQAGNFIDTKKMLLLK